MLVIFSFTIANRGLVGESPFVSLSEGDRIYSYTFYLAHFFVIGAVDDKFPSLSIPALMIASGLLITAYGAAMYELIEAPLAGWRRSLHKVDEDATIVTLVLDSCFRL